MASKIITYVLVVLILTALVAAILANSMTKPLSHDEQMYCTGAVLLARGKMIYRDFSYVGQMPYHPLLLAGLFKALDTTHYLLAGRGLSAVCDILVAVCILGIYRRIFASFSISGTVLGLAAVVLYVFNPLVDYANGYAWNHDVVMLCIMLSFWLFISTDFEQKSKYCRIALIGALLTLATFMRITTALIQLLFFAVLLAQPAESIKQRFKISLPFLTATAVVSIWPIWTVASAHRAFFLNLFWIPMLNGQWQRQVYMLDNKFYRTLGFLKTPGYVLLIAMALYFYLIAWLNRRRLKTSELRDISFAALLALVFFIIAFVPPTMMKQYLAMPVPLLIIGFVWPLLHLRKLSNNKINLKIQFNINCLVIAAGVAVTIISHPVVLRRTPKLFDRQSWPPVRLHRISEDIAEKTKGPEPMLTLAPLFALEGGRNIYPQLSAGPFAYRVADFMSPAARQITHTTGPKTVSQVLRDCPPSAVILGVEPKFLEEPLFDAAVEPNWRRHIYSDNGPIVYFRR